MYVCVSFYYSNPYLTSFSALRALIQAIIPDSGLEPNGKLSGQDVAKLTEKLSELVGPSPVQKTRNERGEVCPYSTCLFFGR